MLPDLDPIWLAVAVAAIWIAGGASLRWIIAEDATAGSRWRFILGRRMSISMLIWWYALWPLWSLIYGIQRDAWERDL